MKKTSITIPFKSLHQVLYGYIKCYSWSSPRPVKSPRSTVDRQDLIKLYWKSENISIGGQQGYCSQFFHRKKTNRAVVTVDFSPTFLNTGTTDETFQQSGKGDSFK